MRRLLQLSVLVLTFALTPIAFGADSARIALMRKIPQVNLTNVPLSDALDFVRDVSSANLHVNWKAIEVTGVGKDTQVNLRARDVRLEKVLTLLLNEASGGSELLTFYVDGGVIEITTREEADKQMITRVYPIQDLIVEIPDFDQAPDLNISQSNTPTSGGGGGGGSGGGIFSGSGSGGSGNQDSTSQMTRAERAEQLIDIITETIRPDIWQKNGGTAAIRFFNGNLIITAPRSVHEMIGG